MTERKGRWKDKVYSKQLMAYTEQALGDDEKNVYTAFFDELVDTHKITSASDIMMLDLVVFDFIRIKRLQKVIKEEGDVVHFTLKNGKTLTKANEASYLMNSIETQLRNNMRELMMTRKEVTKKQLGMEAKDFASWASEAIVVDAEVQSESRSTEK